MPDETKTQRRRGPNRPRLEKAREAAVEALAEYEAVCREFMDRRPLSRALDLFKVLENTLGELAGLQGDGSNSPAAPAS